MGNAFKLASLKKYMQTVNEHSQSAAPLAIRGRQIKTTITILTRTLLKKKTIKIEENPDMGTVDGDCS